MRLVRVAAVGLALAAGFMSGCASNGFEDAIQGTWKTTNCSGEQLEFDGDEYRSFASTTDGGPKTLIFSGPYKVVGLSSDGSQGTIEALVTYKSTLEEQQFSDTFELDGDNLAEVGGSGCLYVRVTGSDQDKSGEGVPEVDSTERVEAAEPDCSDPGAGKDSSGCDLRDAFSGRPWPTMNQSVLRGTNLSGVYTLEGRFAEADLTGAILTEANFYGGVFSEADLTSAVMRGTKLNFADLSGADLTNADLTGAFLVNANLTGATLDGAILTDVEWGSTTCPDGSLSSEDNEPCPTS
jgi:uncharacterized protein YjbI with pentapeptide repeats